MMEMSISDQLRSLAGTTRRDEAKTLIQGAEAVEALSSHVGALMEYILKHHPGVIVPGVIVDSARAIMNLQMGEPLRGADS